MLRFSRNLAILATAFLVCGVSAAQQAKPVPETQSADAKIARALKEVSAEKIQETIQHLVGFHTRLTVSTNLPAESGRGVVAAANWIQQQFETYSKDCGGCLQVKTFKFTQEPTPRIPEPTEITDVYAVLPGADVANAKRIYVITGHYDSIAVAKMTDPEAEAPGANDDGSGTAVVLETARVLSKNQFPATINNRAVAGEEQGLNGSKGFAKMA